MTEVIAKNRYRILLILSIVACIGILLSGRGLIRTTMIIITASTLLILLTDLERNDKEKYLKVINIVNKIGKASKVIFIILGITVHL